MPEEVKRTSISLPSDLLEGAIARAHLMRYKNFSEYLAFLISSDLKDRPSHSTVREEEATFYTKSKPIAPRGTKKIA